jgi:hypothetical protein
MIEAEQTTITAYFLAGEPGRFTELVKATDADPKGEPSAEQRETSGAQVGGVRVAARIMDSNRWWEHYYHSVTHAACCNAKTRDIVGGGFTVDVPGGMPNVPDTTIAEIATVIDRSLPAFEDAVRDWEVTGWCGLECLPALVGGKLHSLSHIDSWTLWPALDNQHAMHSRDGMRAVKYAMLGNREPGLYQLAWLNNLHWYKNTYYGVPDVVAVLTQIDTAWEALKHNRDFFARRGGYRWLMLLSSPVGSPDPAGDPKLVQTINYQTTKVAKGSEADMVSIPIGSRTATLHKLDADVKDMDFAGLHVAYRNDILMAHGVPPLKAGIVETGSLGGNVGQEQLRSYRENVVDPKQRQWNRLVERIIREFWGVTVRFRFNSVELDDTALLALPITTLFKAEVMTRAEARAALGLPDVDDGVPTWAGDLGLSGEFNPFDPQAQQPGVPR